MEADPYLTSTPDGTLLLDEWQHLPQVWDMVRRSVDAGAPPGRFLLTGSATPKPDSTTHRRGPNPLTEDAADGPLRARHP